MLRLKFQSVSDVITNSSSELFQLKTDLNVEAVREIIEEVGRKNVEACPDKWWLLTEEEKRKFDCCSGMGRELTIYSWEEIFKRSAEGSVVPSKRDQYTPEIWSLGYEESLDELKSMVWVEIDWSRYATLKYILENFWVVEGDVGYWDYWQIDPKTEKRVRLVSKEMYDTLPEECKEKIDF